MQKLEATFTAKNIEIIMYTLRDLFKTQPKVIGVTAGWKDVTRENELPDLIFGARGCNNGSTELNQFTSKGCCKSIRINTIF